MPGRVEALVADLAVKAMSLRGKFYTSLQP
jgi:hypothetical protein